MHCLLIHQVFVGPADGGGTRHFEFGRYLVTKGHRFTIVASQVNYLTGRTTVAKPKLIFEENIEGLRVLRAYTTPTLHKSFFWRVFSFLVFMFTSVLAGFRAGPVDLVIGTSPPLFQAISAWIVAALLRKPFLLEIRDLWPDFAIDMGVLKNRTLIRVSRWMEGFMYRRATHILVNSPAYRTCLMAKGVPEKKVTIIPNGVDPEMFNPDATGEEVRRNLGLNGEFVVTYAGALGMANDIPTLLRAAHRLREQREIKFLLVGDGKERPNLEQMARELALSNVIFTGVCPKSQVSSILAASDACIAILQNIPMFRTTYPNKVFDYMAAGRPTILVIDGAIREVIESSKGGVFVAPGDDRELAAAVLSLSGDKVKSRQLGVKAREYVVRHFNRHVQAQAFSELVQQCALPAMKTSI